MLKLSKFGEEFLLLALRIDKRIEGYIDFYFGPEKLKKRVENESVTSSRKLLEDSNTLIQSLGVQGYNKGRERYLEKLLTAMKTSVELLNGAEYSIKDQFLRLYDVNLKPVKEADLEELKEEVTEAYPGSGTLEERMNKLRVVRKVPEAKIIELLGKALKIAKERTKDLFIDLLPESERITIQLVENNNNKVKWSYYEWYLGNFNSRLDINPNYNIFWTSFLPVAAHEGYPGHHTEFAIKEMKLYNELNHFEHSLLIIHSPSLIISEGIANTAISLLFSDQEVAEISLKEFCPDATQADSIELLASQNKVRRKLSLFWYNLAYRALIDKYNKAELFRYGKNFEVFGDDTIQNNIKRFSDPVYSKNAFLYDLGTNLIKKKYGVIPLVKNFQNLLEKAILPSDLE